VAGFIEYVECQRIPEKQPNNSEALVEVAEVHEPSMRRKVCRLVRDRNDQEILQDGPEEYPAKRNKEGGHPGAIAFPSRPRGACSRKDPPRF